MLLLPSILLLLQCQTASISWGAWDSLTVCLCVMPFNKFHIKKNANAHTAKWKSKKLSWKTCCFRCRSCCCRRRSWRFCRRYRRCRHRHYFSVSFRSMRSIQSVVWKFHSIDSNYPHRLHILQTIFPHAHPPKTPTKTFAISLPCRSVIHFTRSLSMFSVFP